MKQAEFDVVVKQTIESIQKLLSIKGGEYAGSEDRLANFKRGSALTGTTPLQCLFIYLSKHYDAIATFVRDDASGSIRVMSEPIEGRLDDLINYALLAKALVQEKRELANAEAFASAQYEAIRTEQAGQSDRDYDFNRNWIHRSAPDSGRGIPPIRHTRQHPDAAGPDADLHRS